ncbi:TPA: serine acetyltransferase, partial [Escherichia coli]
MLSYLMAIHFVLFGNSTNLKNFWKYEVIRRKRMDIWRLLRE